MMNADRSHANAVMSTEISRAVVMLSRAPNHIIQKLLIILLERSYTKSNDWDRDLCAAEHVLLARGEGLKLLPPEWRT